MTAATTVRPVPDWLRHDDTAADRLLVAAWLQQRGHVEAALQIARSVLPNPQTADEALDDLTEAIARRDACHDDPQHYAWVEYAIDRPGAGRSWLEWGDAECEQLTAVTLVSAAAWVRRAS